MDARYFLNAIQQGQNGQAGSRRRPSYESDLSTLPEKQRPKYTPGYNPALHGLLGGFAGDWPGMKLRKTDEDPDVKYDFYNPFARDAKPNQFASPEEQLDYESGQGAGELSAAATLVPAIVKNGGRMLLSALAGRELGAARGDAANAARWMSPKVEAQAGNAAMLGDEAAQSANEAGKRVGNATRGVADAANFGSELDPAIGAGSRLIGARAAGATVDGILGAARGSVSDEDAKQGQLPPVSEEDFHADDMSGSIHDDTQAKPGSADALLGIMSGRKQITPYQQKDNLLEKIAYMLFPQTGRENHAANEHAYLENEIMKGGYVDPETQFRLQELQGQNAAGRASDMETQRGNVQLRNSLAPTMSSGTLEDILGTHHGSIDPKLLERMTRQKDETALLELLLSGGLPGMGGQQQQAGPQQVNAPVLNIPKHR